MVEKKRVRIEIQTRVKIQYPIKNRGKSNELRPAMDNRSDILKIKDPGGSGVFENIVRISIAPLALLEVEDGILHILAFDQTQ